MPVTSKTTLKRINKEIADLQKEDVGDILLYPQEDNIHRWTGWIPGPDDGPYKGGQFELKVELPADYPFSPPRVGFETPIYHCNVNSTGSICLDILKNNWSPALSLYKVMLSISALLCEPNPNDPLVGNIAAQLRKNKAEHDRVAQDHTNHHAASPTNLQKRENYKQSLLTSGKLKENNSKPSTPGPSSSTPRTHSPAGPRPTTAIGRPIAGTARAASSTSVNSDAVASASLAPPARSRNEASPLGLDEEIKSSITEPVSRAGTRRTAADVVDITDEGDDIGAGSSSRRVRARLDDGPGGSTDDAIVVD